MTPGERIQGRYRLVEALGSGGMATVWRAHDERLDRDVALKCLDKPLSEDPSFLVRFFGEAQAVARLSHPNVVRVLDFGDGADCPYLVMEYVPGGSVAALGAPVQRDLALALTIGAARGAGAAHDAGLVHRDLKPANILVSDTGTPKIVDFGIAVSEAQERLTATGTAIGSPHYVSPEQASGRPVGPASDVYSLGVVLYELLTGVRPFEAENATALAIAHVEQEPEPPSVHVSGLDPAVDAIVMRCLAKDPAARFENGNDLAATLERLSLGESTDPFAIPVAAAIPSSPDDEEVEPRNIRRAATIGALVVAFVALSVLGVVALGGRDEPEDRAVASDSVLGGSVNQSESPTPRDTEDGDREDEFGVTTATTPSPSATENEAGTPTPKPTRARESNTDEKEEEGATPEPTNEPTSEPTAEPTSAPTP